MKKKKTMKNLRKRIVRYLQGIAVVVVTLILWETFAVLMFSMQRASIEDADSAFHQIEQILAENEKRVKEDEGKYWQNSLHNAESIEYIFSLLKVNVGVDFYAIDMGSGEIMGATNDHTVGKNMTEIGLTAERIEEKIEAGDGFHAFIDGENTYCVFTVMGSNYIGRVVSTDVLYEDVPFVVIGLALALTVIAIAIVWAVAWYVNKFVIKGIDEVNDKLVAITDGDLGVKIDVQSSLELSELSSHINEMIKSLLASTDKIAYVLDRTNLRIGVYEHNANMKSVRFTRYVSRILGLDEESTREMESDYSLFREYIDKVRENPLEEEENMYRLDGEKEVYIKLEEITTHNDTLGVILDVTEEVKRRRQLETERDMDPLTGLYNRRGLDIRLAALFKNPQKLGYGALIMIDADGLKEINDKYGHEKGDIYLKKIADVLSSFGLKSCVAARQGGDEFVLFLYNYDSVDELAETIQTLEFIQQRSSAYLSEDVSVPLRFSYGISLTKGETDYSALLKEADAKMYENKRERKQARF